jgi:hypothetical protein
MAGIGGNERCITYHASMDLQGAAIKLLLKVGPDSIDHACVDHPVLERHDG